MQSKYAAGAEVEAIPTNHAVVKFIQLLTERYPQIDDASEDELDDCPWTCAFNCSENMCIMNICWSDVEEIAPEIVALAEDCGLLCYDLQSGTVLAGVRHGDLPAYTERERMLTKRADSEAKQ